MGQAPYNFIDMWKHLVCWNIAVRLEEVARRRCQFVLDIFEIPDNIGTIAVLFAPQGLRVN